MVPVETEMISSPVPRIWTNVCTAVCIISLLGIVWVLSDRRTSATGEAVPEPWTVLRSSLVRDQTNRLSDLVPFSMWRPGLAVFVDRQPVSPGAAAILRDGFVAATAHDPALRQANLEILERMANIRWPRVADLPRIHVVMPHSHPRTLPRGWLVDQDDENVRWLTDDFEIETAHQTSDPEFVDGFRKIESANLAGDLREFLDLLAERAHAERKWEWDHEHGILEFFDGGPEQRLLRMIFTAAECGLRDEVHAAVKELFRVTPRALQDLEDDFVKVRLERAAAELSPYSGAGQIIDNLDDWRDFFSICQELRAVYPQSQHARRLDSFIERIAAELGKPVPAFATKPRAELTEAETIRLLIHQFRDFVGVDFAGMGPHLFSDESPAQRLVLIGPRALPYLVEAVDDQTVCRTNDYDRHVPDHSKLLRRQDFVFECLERITGCTFFVASTRDDEPAERRAAGAAHVRRWWKLCRGKSQADMLRAYLSTLPTNESLRDYESDHPECRRRAILLLAHIEGPEGVLDDLRNLPQEWHHHDELTAVEQFSPQRPAQWAFLRLKEPPGFSQLRLRDIDELLTYGDYWSYQQLAKLAIECELRTDPETPGKKRFAAETPRERPAVLFNGQHVQRAVKFGQNWAIPLLFAMLRNSTEDPSLGEPPRSTADLAMSELIKLTGRDFGYDPLAAHADRVAVFHAARVWADKANWQELGRLVGAEHPLVRERCDLYLTAAQIDKLSRTIATADPPIRRLTIAELGDVYSYQIQRALLDALDREPDSQERLNILKSLATSPMLWHIPKLTQTFDRDPANACQVAAARIIAELMRENTLTSNLWGIRLETREAAVHAARRAALDRRAPLNVRQAALEILLAASSPIDETLLEHLDKQPEFRHLAFVVKFAGIFGENHPGDFLAAALARIVSQGDENDCFEALLALRFLGPDGAPAIPSLLGLLDRPDCENEFMREMITQTFMAIGAKSAIRPLVDRLQDKQRSTAARDAATSALSRLDPQSFAGIVVPYLIVAIREGDDRRRLWAALLLEFHALRASTALPELKARAASGGRQLRHTLQRAIRAIEAASSENGIGLNP
jgi:hypothetical protein